MSDLTDLVREKYPDAYKDMSDDDLEKAILDKYPQYAHLAAPKNKPQAAQPVNQPAPAPVAAAPAAAEEPSFLHKLWTKANEPLTDLPTRIADRVSNYIDPGRGTTGLRSDVSAAVEALGRFGSGFTSPLNIGMEAATLGASGALSAGLPSVAQGLRRVAQAASIPMVLQGGYDTITKPHIDEKLAGLSSVVLGGLGLANGSLGRIADKAKESIPEAADSLPISELPHDLVPVGSEKEFNDEISFGRPSNEDLTYQAAAERKGIVPLPAPDELKDRFNQDNNINSTSDDAEEIQDRKIHDAHQKAADIALSDSKSGTMSASDLAKLSDRSIPKTADPETVSKLKTGMADPVVLKLQRNGNNPGPVDIYGDNYGTSGALTVDSGHATIAAAKKLGMDAPVKVVGGLRDSIDPSTMNPYQKLYDESGNLINKNQSIDDIFNKPGKSTLSFQNKPRTLEDINTSRVKQEYASDAFSRNEEINKASEVFPEAKADTPELPEETEGPTVTKLKEPTPELIQQAKAKGPNELYIRKPTPELIDRAHQYGYTFDGLMEDGQFRMVKQGGKATRTPLEIMNGEGGGEPPSGGDNEGEPPEPPEPPDEPGNSNPRKRSLVLDALNFPKTVMSTLNFHAPLRQALPMIANKAWWTSWDDMFKAWGSEKAFNQVQSSITEHPNFPLAKKAGLHLTDLGDLSTREESMFSTLAEKVPGIRASNRAYTAFLNKTRFDAFNGMIEDAKALNVSSGEYNLPLTKEIANFINIGTGRGSLGRLESSAANLNSVLFSPRLIASRLQMLNPAYFVMSSRFVQMQHLKSLFAIAGLGATIGGLTKLAGGEVNLDRTSADFGKAKIGNTRIDPYAGFQQYIVAANKLEAGRSTSTTSGRVSDLTTGKFGSKNRLDVVGQFAESKLNPPVAFAIDLLRGKTPDGRPLNIPESVARMFIPMVVQDLKSITTNNSDITNGKSYGNFDATKAPLAIPAMFGMNEQNYGPPSR